MIDYFYENMANLFLNLMMNFMYNIYDFKLLGVTHDEAAVSSLKIVITAIHNFEDDFNEKYGGGIERKILENEINVETKKESKQETKTKKPTKKRTKKNKVSVEEKKE